MPCFPFFKKSAGKKIAIFHKSEKAAGIIFRQPLIFTDAV